MKVKDLRPSSHNPRTITEERLDMLESALAEFGDLGAVVFNKKTKRLVGGHQRTKIFDNAADIVITRKFSKPTKVGTVAEGYITFNGERFKYREVFWSEAKETAANLAANKSAGDWEPVRLSDSLKKLVDFEFDVSLSMFDRIEVKSLTKPPKPPKAKLPGETKGKEKKRVVCPECDHRFVPGWS